MLSTQQKLSAAFLRVVDARSGWAPYFGAVLQGLIRRETKMGSLAVTRDGLLLWDPDFVNKHTVEEIALGLMHEAMHVMLKIWERGNALGVTPEPTPDKHAKAYLLNIAHDACINGELRKMNVAKLPATWVFPETLDQPEGLVLEERYARLLQEVQKQQQAGSGADGDEGEPQDGKGQGQPGIGQGWCGSCAHHPVPQEPPAAKGKTEGRSEAEMDRFVRETAEAIKHTAAKDPGKVPDSFKRWADEILAPAKIDWRTKLSRLVRSAVAYRPGAVDFTWQKPSRRQAGIGYGVGRALVPAYHAPQPNVGIIFDTSGSMGSEELALGAAEVQGVLNGCGAAISMVAVDCTAQEDGVKSVTSIQDALALLKGGGGTNMTPGFEAFEHRKPRPEVLIVFTDGHIGDGYPETAPSWARTIWVVVGQGGNPNPCPWGEVVVVDESGAREAA